MDRLGRERVYGQTGASTMTDEQRKALARLLFSEVRG